MLDKNMSKQEIEKILAGKGDFVQIDYLTRLLKKDISIDMKKFVYLKLAGIYDKKSMFLDAAKAYDSAAVNSIRFSEKMKNYVKETESHIKAGAFNDADKAMKKAMNEANASEKAEIYFTIKEFYKKQAKAYEKEMRRNHAVKIYEKVMEMKISELERKDIREKLVKLYEKLGKFQEADKLKGLNPNV